MGTGFSFPWKSLKKKKVVMIGLDNAGKTTILYKLKLKTVVNTIPTIGFNVEEVKIEGFTMLMWDLGGQVKLRPLWHHYLSKANAIIFVLDSADEERIDTNERSARQELDNILSDQQADGIPLLVIANKQDMSGALSVSTIEERLHLRDYKDRKWHIQPASATDPKDTGIMKGLQWLSDELISSSKPGFLGGLFSSRRRSTGTDEDLKSPLPTPSSTTSTSSAMPKPSPHDDGKHSISKPSGGQARPASPQPGVKAGQPRSASPQPGAKSPTKEPTGTTPKATVRELPSEKKTAGGGGAAGGGKGEGSGGSHRRTRSHIPDKKKEKYATYSPQMLAKGQFSNSAMEIDQEKEYVSDSSPSPSPQPKGSGAKKKKKLPPQSKTLQKPLHFHYENNKKAGT